MSFVSDREDTGAGSMACLNLICAVYILVAYMSDVTHRRFFFFAFFYSRNSLRFYVDGG